MIDLQVRLGQGYTIRIGPWRDWDLRALFRDWPPGPWLLVVDRKAWGYWASDVLSALGSARIEPRILELAGGEQAKTHATLFRIYDALQASKAGRDGTLAVFGGGVLGDLAGFAAATWKRGIRFVQIPTTLLSQVDSSVGGKTGLNYAEQKNLVGCFHQPSAVLISPEWLNSLDQRELRAGLAEVVKCGVIRDTQLLSILDGEAPDTLGRSPALEEILARALAVKSRIVEEDERDLELRHLLNFGHTVGHAIEAATGFSRFLHGEAVALGMVAALQISRSVAGLSEEEETRVQELLHRFSLPVRSNGIAPEEILSRLSLDKKARAGRPVWVLTERLGTARINPDVPLESVREAVTRILT